MKVGIISRGSPDYLVDVVTDGFIRLLGRSSVSLDYNVRGGWGGPYIHLLQGFQGPEPFDIHEADLLVASNRSGPALREWKKRTGKTKIAFLDGEDSEPLIPEYLNHAQVYFKREYIKHRTYPGNVKPLQFAAIPEALENEVEVTNKVFYSGHDTHPFRKEVGRTLRELGFPPVQNQEKALYNRALMRSLVGVAVRGNGWDTYRYWEIPYFGAVLLSQRPGIVIPNDFIDGQEAVHYDSISDLKQKLKHLLENPQKAQEIAASGRKAAMERHLSINRAKAIMSAIS